MTHVNSLASNSFPNYLLAPSEETRAKRPLTWAPALLLFACLVPRLAVVPLVDTICADGVFYIQLAKGYEHGDSGAGLGTLGLNVYPLVLATVHSLGLDWNLAGKLWGVTAGSLTVLPIFGWIRRQFDDRVAIWACLLYAIHPKLISWSPELVRDSTFWLCLAMTTYAGWRALTELSFRWSLVLGLCFTLGVLTRFEGWFLAAPLSIWGFARLRALDRGRWRLVGLGVSSALVIPAVVVFANLTLLRSAPNWEFGGFERFRYVGSWLGLKIPEKVTPAPGSPPDSAPVANVVAANAAPESRTSSPAIDLRPPTGPNPRRMPLLLTAFVYFNALRRGFDPIHGLLMLLGVISWRRTWWRTDHLPMFVFALLTLAGIWIHLWHAQETSSRYALSMVILGTPFTALGFLQLTSHATALFSWFARSANSPIVTRGALFGGFAVLGLVVAASENRAPRRLDANLGRWLAAERGPRMLLLGSRHFPLVAYYADARFEPLPINGDGPYGAKMVAAMRPDAVVLSRRRTPAETASDVVAMAKSAGMIEIDSDDLPSNLDRNDLIVLLRPLSPPSVESLSDRPTHGDGEILR